MVKVLVRSTIEQTEPLCECTYATHKPGDSILCSWRHINPESLQNYDIFSIHANKST